VPCECGQVFIGQTGRSIQTRVKEHQSHIRPEQPVISINLGHRIKLQDTTNLFTKATCVDRMIREAIEMEYTRTT
jgi:hypothetical protein